MLIFFFLLLIIPCLALKKRGDGTLIFNGKETTCLKGILCLFVMFHNLGLDYYQTDGIPRLIAEHAGGVGVGLFFFLSAFGIVRSYQKYGNSFLKRLLLVHIPKIYFVAVFINLLTYFVFFKGQFETGDAVLRILNLDLFNNFNRINRHGWYIASVLALYVIFAIVYFICSKLKTKRNMLIATIIMIALPIALRIAAHIFDNGGMYTREIHAFSTGIFYATYYNKINSVLKKYFYPFLIISFLSLWIGFFFFEPLCTHMAAIFLVTLAQKFTWENKITLTLGKACLGVYLYLHFSTMVLQQFINNPYYWTLINAGFILLLAFMTYGVQYGIEWSIKHLIEKIKRKRLPAESNQ